MQVCLLKSNKGARFHFGESVSFSEKDEINALHSTTHYLYADTLFSAIINAWALKNPHTLENFISVCKKGYFKISSGFYCIKTKQKTVFFLPKPVSLNLLYNNDSKKIKRIKLISSGIWEKGLLPNDWFDSEKCTLLQNDTMVALKEEINYNISVYEIITTPKVNVRTENKKESYYLQTDLYMLGDEDNTVYWYFLMEKQLDRDLEKHLSEALQTFIHLGIGGDRSAGGGALKEFEIRDFSLNINSSNYTAGFSPVIPIKNELTKRCLYYVKKRGSQNRKVGKLMPMYHVLQEGAVLNPDIKGQIISLNENPPILRYGINFSFPLHNNFVKGIL